MLTVCAAINSVHWLLTRLIRKKTVFAYHARRGGYRSADEHHKNSRKLLSLPSSVSVHHGLMVCRRMGRNSAPKTCFLASGLINDFWHMCVNQGVDKLCGNRAARTADQRFLSLHREYTLCASY